MSEGARARTAEQRYFGVAEGIVSEVDDPAREGRVKLRLPWFDDDYVTDWCRVSYFYAGGGYGALFVPEVGDEVVVAFVHGDFARPVVLGGHYNGVDKPATHHAAGRDEKVIRTRAGHQILLVDTGGSERIEISDAGGKNRIEIDTTSRTITISADGDVAVEAAKGKLTLSGSTGVEITSKASVKVQGTTIELN